MTEDKLNEAIKYNLDYLEGNYSIEEDLEETYKCLKETQQELDQYKNIVKEVREYILDAGVSYIDFAGNRNFCNKNHARYILKILDKVGD